MMRFVLFMVALVMVMPFAAMAQDDIDPKAYCLQNFPKGNVTGIDAEAYCSCAAKELGGKLNQAKEDDEKGRKKAVANLKPCLDKHAKKPVTQMCDTYNERVKEAAKDSKEKPQLLNCNCFYKKLVANFSESWSGQSGNELTQEQQQALALETVGACLK